MSSEKKSHQVSFSIGDHEAVTLEEGENLAVHLDVQNSPLLFGCRTGICGTCLIQVDEAGAEGIEPPSEDEKQLLEIIAPENPKARLACQIHLTTSLRIKPIPQE